MRSDIQRELDLVASDHGDGDVLAALGLVVYTEVSSVGSFVGNDLD